MVYFMIYYDLKLIIKPVIKGLISSYLWRRFTFVKK